MASLHQRFLRLKTRTRWKFYRWLDGHTSPPARLQCRLCRHSGPRDAFRTLQARCSYLGGSMLRFECPGCGVIFGPLRMLGMKPDQLAREYREAYALYEEGDSTESELKTFRALEPRRGECFLNYGAGRWNKTVEILRGEGWDVRAYEPFSQAGSRAPGLITRAEDLRSMRFDGILSQNLIEHLQDPVAAFRQMRALLRGPGARMIHTTPCYEYKVEDTRFHIFFFTGRSPEILAQQAGLAVEDLDPGFGDGGYQIAKRFRPAL